MTSTPKPINPFLAARMKRVSPFREQPSLFKRLVFEHPHYVKYPTAPRNASPVPHLTSLYYFSQAGEYGDRSCPGNCGGNLIKDLIHFFNARSVFDPMTGSGTCRDVWDELGV